MNIKEIEFKPYNPAHNDLNSEDGELEGAAGMPSPGLEVEFVLEVGELIAMHQQRAIVYHEGKLMWAIPEEDDPVTETDLQEIAEIPRPASITIMGATLITTGGDSFLYHYWNDRGYVTLPQLPPLPKIEFGLLKEGEMTGTCSLTVPASMVTSQDGNGMTDPHPSANTTGGGDATEYIDKIIDTLILNAHDDRRRRGYFTTPFFVRYALTDHGGNCLCVSPPVLMAGSVLPPCMAVLSTTNDEKNATMRIRLAGSAYFSLMVRACPLPAEWMSVVKSIDIYVSPQIPTWSSGTGYLCSYSNVLGHVNGGSGHRGRANSDTTADSMFAGHYSDDGINYTDHFTDAILRQTQVWYVSPNAGMTAEIVAEHRFYRIASLAPACLGSMTAFSPLPVETTAAAHLESFERLPEEAGSVSVFPDVLATLNGRLVGAGGAYALAGPADVAISSAFSGNTASSTLPAEICVFTRLPLGELRRISVNHNSGIDLASAFPRYIYHPDSAAEIMTIRSGGVRYRLPLSRHPTMSGAFWFGGFGVDSRPAPDTATLPEAIESDRISCSDRIWLSSPFSHRHFSLSQSLAACNSSITAVSTSVVAPDVMAIGKYPVYVFAEDGVWMLEYDSGSGRLCGSHRISSEICVSAAAVALTDEGVAFATDRSLLLLSGNKIRRLLSLRSLPVRPAPHFYCADTIGEKTESSPSLIISPALAYDGASSSLIVADTSSGVTCLIDIASRAASLWSRNTISIPLTAGRPLIQADSREVGHLSSSASISGMAVTRPIKLTKTFTPKIIRGVTIWHSGSPGSIAVKVYGANSLADWHLIASSGCHRAEIVSRSLWRFLRIAVLPKDGEPEIYGAQINFEC